VLPAEAHGAPGAALVAARPLILTALALLVAGCGDEDEGGGVNSTGTELQIALDPDGPGGAEPKTAIVRCELADGSVCGRLNAADLAPVDPQMACTEIYGGPDVAEIDGFIGDEPVETTLTRANGCEIERFDRIVPVLKQEFPGYEPGAAIAP
jgi:hypothetical protein